MKHCKHLSKLFCNILCKKGKHLCQNAVVLKKIGKTCYFKTLFRQKQGQNGPHPKSSLVFFSGNNKRSYDLSKTFFFYQNIKSFDWVKNDCFLVWNVTAKTVHFQLKQLLLVSCRILLSLTRKHIWDLGP